MPSGSRTIAVTVSRSGHQGKQIRHFHHRPTILMQLPHFGQWRCCKRLLAWFILLPPISLAQLMYLTSPSITWVLHSHPARSRRGHSSAVILPRSGSYAGNTRSWSPSPLYLPRGVTGTGSVSPSIIGRKYPLSMSRGWLWLCAQLGLPQPKRREGLW